MAKVKVVVMLDIEKDDPIELRGDDQAVLQIADVPVMQVARVVAERLSSLPIPGFRSVESIVVSEVEE